MAMLVELLDQAAATGVDECVIGINHCLVKMI